MWNYEKRLQFPVKIDCVCPEAAQVIISQLGGPDGEIAASMRYLNQRYSMPDRRIAGLLTDIGTEELAHMEMVAAMIHQLTKGMSDEDVKRAGLDIYFVDHTAGVWPQAASGTPFQASFFQSKGDAITDLFDPILSGLTVTFNGDVWTEGVNYTYDAATGAFATVPGQITVPAATFTQNASGVWVTDPGTSILRVTGTV